MISQENKIIHGLWIGKKLSVMELLCIKSFIRNNHEFWLWAYDVIETQLPDKLVVKDASKIIPREKVFCYRHSNQFGHGKGSYAGFSDIFRYKLLYEYGGWWVDMDVVCLKPFDFNEPYIFRTHHDFAMVGNMMKCPPRSELMKLCFDRAVHLVDENNRDWNLPIKILNDTINELQLNNYIKDFSNQDSWLIIRKMLYKDYAVPESWYALHLVNEEWRRNRINKNAIPYKSYIGKLLKTYGLLLPSPGTQRFKNLLRVVIIRISLQQIPGLINKYFWKFVRVFKKEKTKRP